MQHIRLNLPFKYAAVTPSSTTFDVLYFEIDGGIKIFSLAFNGIILNMFLSIKDFRDRIEQIILDQNGEAAVA